MRQEPGGLVAASQAAGLAPAWLPPALPAGLVRGGRANADDCAIGADNDLDAIADWLRQFAGPHRSPHTHRAYERECKRFYYWLVTHGPGELRAVRVEHVSDFIRYLHEPPEAEIDPREKARPLDAPQPYYPFRGRLSASSLSTAISAVGSLFSHLTSARYLAYNAFSMSSGKPSRHRAAQVERFLPERVFAELLKTVELLPAGTIFEATMRARADLIVKLAYVSMARVADLARHHMSSFRLIESGGSSAWWWSVTGKGGKPALIPLNDDVLQALATYRRLLLLPPQPNRLEHIPIVFSERRGRAGKGGLPMSESAIYRVVVDLAKRTAARLHGEGRNVDAETVSRATTHWLRHTGISQAVARGANLIDVMKTARHSDLNTTRLYMHTEDAERHRSMAGALSLEKLKPP